MIHAGPTLGFRAGPGGVPPTFASKSRFFPVRESDGGSSADNPGTAMKDIFRKTCHEAPLKVWGTSLGPLGHVGAMPGRTQAKIGTLHSGR